MTMLNKSDEGMRIIEATRRALNCLEEEFRAEPSLFFTEHDLASRAYQLVQEELGHRKVRGNDGKSHYLVHHEYPTPFKCDMRGTSFTPKPQDSKYKRGHYDLVVFNPKFLQHQKCNYKLAKGQHYAAIKSHLPGVMTDIGEAPILVGVEFMFNRDTFASEKSVEDWWKGVLQDYQKLDASRQWMDRPFMQEIVMMAFDAFGQAGKNERVRADLTRYTDIMYCAPIPQR